jgi:hypothetical protein
MLQSKMRMVKKKTMTGPNDEPGEGETGGGDGPADDKGEEDGNDVPADGSDDVPNDGDDADAETEEGESSEVGGVESTGRGGPPTAETDTDANNAGDNVWLIRMQRNGPMDVFLLSMKT